MSAPRHHGPQLPAILESWQPSQLRVGEVDDLIRQDCPALSHLWVAPDERVSVAEVFLGRLVAGVGGPARFHVTAKGDGGVGAPVEEVDEETASSALNSCSEQALASLRHLDCSSHSSLWSIQGMNELTKASDVTSEPKSEKRSRLSPTNYHFRRSRQLQGFGFRSFREMIILKYGITAPNKIKMSVNKVEIYMLKSSTPAYWLIHDFKIWSPQCTMG